MAKKEKYPVYLPSEQAATRSTMTTIQFCLKNPGLDNLNRNTIDLKQVWGGNWDYK